MSDIILMKSEVSVMYDGSFCTCGCKEWSLNLDKLLVSELMESSAGLPGFPYL